MHERPLVREVERERPDAASLPAAGAPRGWAASLVGLQRTAGNRAVGALLARRQPRMVARCGNRATRRVLARKPKRVWVDIRFRTDEAIDARELRIRARMQVFEVSRKEAEAEADAWAAQGHAFITDPKYASGVRGADVGREITLSVEVTPAEGAEDHHSEEVAALTERERAGVNKEANRRYWARSGSAAGRKLSLGKSEAGDRELWFQARNAVLRDRQSIEALPARIHDFLAPGDSEIPPEDYEAALRCAELLNRFTEEDWALYSRRVNAVTHDYAAIESSLKRFLVRQSLEGDIRSRVEGTEALWHQVQDFKKLDEDLRRPHRGGVRKIDAPFERKRWEAAKASLDDAIHAAGFADAAAYGDACAQYLRVFRDRAVEIANLALKASEQQVRAELERHSAGAANAALFEELGSFRQLDREARELAEEAKLKGIQVKIGPTPRQIEAGREAKRKAKQAAAERARLAKDYALLQDPELSNEDLAEAEDATKLGRLLREDAWDRLADITGLRGRLIEDAETVFQFDRVIAYTKTELGVAPDSIGALIVGHHQEQIAEDSVLRAVALTIFAIGLGLLTLGGGTVAILAGGASLGLSIYQAGDEWERYTLASAAAHSALNPEGALSSDEPSAVWVALALVGVGLEGASLASAIGASVKAARLLDETRDVGRFEAQLAKSTALSEDLKLTLTAAAHAEVQYRTAAEELTAALRASMGKVYAGGLDPDVLVKMTRAAYYAAKKGIRRFEVFVADLRIQKLAGDVDFDRLTRAEQRSLREAFDSGVEQAATGLEKGVPDVPPVGPDPPPPAPPVVTGAADARTAGTGGVETISEHVNPLNQTEVVIEGRLKGPLAGGRKAAPNFNRERFWGILRKEHGLKNWQAAHLWGPGFGDEAAAGIMLAPDDVNLVWQNQKVERFLRDLQEEAAKQGGHVRLRAVAVSQDRTVAGGVALDHAEYTFSVVDASGKSRKFGRVSFSVGAPPAGKVSAPEVTMFY